MSTGHLAIIFGPNGQIWESTAVVEIGPDAEHRASRLARNKLCHEVVGHFLKVDPPYGLWEALSRSGFECRVIKVELPDCTAT